MSTPAKTTKVEQPCLFDKAQRISNEDLSTTVTPALRVKDEAKDEKLRQIVLVGHSPREDLRILRLLDIDVFCSAPVLTVVDTHSISRFTLPPYHPNVSPWPHQRFSLRAVLAELGCSPETWTFHNAGNDAVYALYAMLLLAIKDGVRRKSELIESESRSLETVTRAVTDAVERGLPKESNSLALAAW